MKILINSRPSQTRIAQIQNGKIFSFYVNQCHKASFVGSIFMGRISKIFKEFQGAFVDIGFQREVYLNFKEEADKKIQKGDLALVQVIKDPVGGKAARVSLSLSIVGRKLVYLPESKDVNISKKIEDEEERQRLIQILEGLNVKGGVIIRTLAEGEKDFKPELKQLYSSFEKIKEQSRKTPGLVYKDVGAEIQILREELGPSHKEVIVDDKDLYEQILDYTQKWIPEWNKKIIYYDKTSPLFESYGIEKQWKDLLNRKVTLKGGGSIVIDETEALVSIDVNMGKALSRSKSSAFQTNIEAGEEVAHQIQLRNCSGMIVIDFIDMDEDEDGSLKERLLESFKKELKKDRMYTEIHSFSGLNLLQMTRKRSRSSLRNIVGQSCPYCSGKGFLLSNHSIAHEIFRSIESCYRKPSEKERFIEITTHAQVIDWIIEKEGAMLDWFKNKYNLTLSFKDSKEGTLEDFNLKDL